MIDKHLVNVHLSSGTTLGGVLESDEEKDTDEVEAEVLAELHNAPREFIRLGGLIVHTGAISAVEVL
jgi:hypothetical protein